MTALTAKGENQAQNDRVNQLAAQIRRNQRQTAALLEVTARNELRFLQTEIRVGRSSARIALCDAGRRAYGAAKRRIATAQEAHKIASRFLERARMDERIRQQLGCQLQRLKRAIDHVHSAIAPPQ